MFISLWFGITLLALVLWLLFYFLERELLTVLAFLCMVASGVTSCGTSEWYQQSLKNDEAAARRRATPHVIREADGCKVYAFETDREHYFTRCGSTVTTETNWTETCGKNCRKEKSDIITTEGNK